MIKYNPVQERVNMLKKLSVSKNQIITLLLVSVFVMGKNIVTSLSDGNPGVLGMTLCIAMSILFVVFFFLKFSAKKEELFTGNGIIRIAGALMILFWSFTRSFMNFDYVVAMVVLPIMIFCASDTKFIPVNAVIALGMAIRFIPVGFVTIPCALFVSFILIAPKIRNAKTWEKIVFFAVMICLIIDLAYVADQMRYMFTMSSVTANIVSNIILVLFALFFTVCVVYSLKKQKKFKSKKTSKMVSAAKKPEYSAALGYIIAVAFAIACTALDARYSMSGLVGLIMSTLMVCKNGTLVEEFSDKAAKSIGRLAEKLFGKN